MFATLPIRLRAKSRNGMLLAINVCDDWLLSCIIQVIGHYSVLSVIRLMNVPWFGLLMLIWPVTSKTVNPLVEV